MNVAQLFSIEEGELTPTFKAPPSCSALAYELMRGPWLGRRTADPEFETVLPIMRESTAMAALKTMIGTPGATARELAAMLPQGASKSGIYYAVRTLVDLGLAEEIGPRPVVYHATPEGRKVARS